MPAAAGALPTSVSDPSCADAVRRHLPAGRGAAGEERFPAIGEVRGLGAMLAIELVADRATKQPAPELAQAVIDAATQRGLLLLKAGVYGNAIRVLCPLVLTDSELDEALGAWKTRSSTPWPSSVFSAQGRIFFCGCAATDWWTGTSWRRRSGSGGMSTVYCAFDTLLERRVALKILHEQFGRDEEHVERFRREARAVAQLSHPNIVTVIDRGEEDGKQFIVFELIEGENLKELVARGPLPVRRVLELGLEVGRALAFAHAQGLVHRDVKPQNVLLNGDGLAKVTDFGIVRTLDAVGQTETGTVLGTSHYIAPEQARGERVDAQTDVYSFGVVLYELLAGDVPYPGDNFLTVAMKHVNEPVPNVLERCRTRRCGSPR